MVAAPRTSLAGQQSSALALPHADYKTEVLNSLHSITTNMGLQIKANYLIKDNRRSSAWASS